MSLEELRNQTIGVLGYGQEGQAVAAYLVKHGLQPIVFEQTSFENWATDLQQQAKALNLQIFSGIDYLEQLSKCQVVFRSPGIKTQIFREYLAEDAAITSQAKFFFENSQAKIIGVTGTKGKGTTSALLFEMLNKQFPGKVKLTGNIGKEQPFNFLDKLDVDSLVVYELSSFQLQDLQTSPQMGICLMVTEDHLDYHQSLEEYYAAKAAVCKYQNGDDITIYNADYSATVNIGKQGLGQKFIISKSDLGQPGVVISKDELTLRNQHGENLQLDISDRILLGDHNRENIAAASLAAWLLGVDLANIKNSISTFSGLPYRLQLTAVKDGISFVNDSISTTPDTALAAIRAFQQPVVSLLGGHDKNIPLDEFILELTKLPNLKAVVTLGTTGEKIKSELLNKGFDRPVYGNFTEFPEAILAAKQAASPGDIVLLSPGFASFGMFKNVYDRGEQFNQLIAAI